jgi:hypothetical protein
MSQWRWSEGRRYVIDSVYAPLALSRSLSSPDAWPSLTLIRHEAEVAWLYELRALYVRSQLDQTRVEQVLPLVPRWSGRGKGRWAV